MAIITVPNLKLLPQDKTNACWYFSAKMVHKWANANQKPKVKDPATVNDDRGNLKGLYESNSGYAPSTCIELAGRLGLTAMPKKKRGFDDFKLLLANGPIWAAGIKGGVTGTAHVVVIGGVADTGLLVLDPLPMNIGTRGWKTWDWMDGFFSVNDGSIDANLLVIK